MKKTVTVNIGGSFFHIDEDAYEILKKYLETIRGYFKNTLGCDEIMADIEIRISEMLKEKLSPQKEVINMEDINQVIGIMGKPEDYIDTENDNTEFSGSAQESSEPFQKTSHTKRIYRDPDNRVIGGVCGGVGAYFGIDPVWLRIAFVIMFFAFGTGPFIYFILWVVIPKAKTTAEKLEMRGEAVTAENIGKTIKEEMNNVKQSFTDITNDINSPKTKQNLRSTTNKLVDFITEFLRLFLNVAGKLIGAALLILTLFLTVMLISLLFTGEFIINITDEGINNFSVNDFFSLFFADKADYTIAGIALLILIAVPVVAMLLAGIKLLFNVKTKFKGMGAALGILWVTGLLLAAYSVYSTAKDFSKKGDIISYTSIADMDTLEIKAGANPYLHNPKIVLFDDEKSAIVSMDNDSLYLCYPKINILKSASDTGTVEIKMIARGRSKKIASERAANINYQYHSIDNTLVLSPYFAINNKEKFRAQQISITIKIPEGKTVYLDENLKHMLYDIENTQNMLDEHMVNKYWTMTRNGLTHVSE
jgi:phage shock protein PspC (stress-responsive transcriptional regulator)